MCLHYAAGALKSANKELLNWAKVRGFNVMAHRLRTIGEKSEMIAMPIVMQQQGDGDNAGRGTSVITRTKSKTKKPNLYRVLLLNDDYTPMEFVIHILERFFQKDREAATRIMLHVHNHGVGECGVFTYEVAETKVSQVMDFARQHEHPLQCVMEKK